MMENNKFDPFTGQPIADNNFTQTPPPYQSEPQASQAGAYVPPQPPPNVTYQQQGPDPNMYAMPPQVHKWNWGAFMYTYIWGVGNRAYLTLLCLVPLLNLVWPFVCGALGNQWAWKSGHFKDLKTFEATQETWNRAGFVAFLIAIAGLAILIVTLIVMVSIFGSIAAWGYRIWY
ncbi:MAG: hypothetical protein LBU41_01455 [Clostridiales Family XIII bacterium]|jgi:hypothetical protein|nr:hypothetical protein [Clostridiales Family XIII bacterium]